MEYILMGMGILVGMWLLPILLAIGVAIIGVVISLFTGK